MIVSIVAAAAFAGAANAQARRDFAVPAGPLAGALAQLSRQAGVDIGGIDPELGELASPGLSGTMTIEEALARMLARTGFRARKTAPGSYRLVRRAPLSIRRVLHPLRSGRRPIDVGSDAIIVTGAKRAQPLATYPGSAIVVALGQDDFGPEAAGSQNYLLRQTPILQSTGLGVGRDKLFIRGVADSSFAGPTQSTVGTYFGEVRTGYSGPYPNLNLYDVDRIEILEGPQGALYGAGSLGGIIRITPNPPVMDRTEATIDTGISTTAHGAAGYDMAAMLNLVPVPDRAAFRLVAYRNVGGGYIDDPGRRVSNVNGVTETGARIAVQVRPWVGWTIEAGFLAQQIHQPDLQYALSDYPPLSRLSAFAQPFKDDYALGRLVVTKEWASGLHLVSATGRVANETDQRYDATTIGQFGRPLAYDEHNHIRLTTQEVRVQRTLDDGSGWLIGAAYVHETAGKTREFGALESPRTLIDVTNRTEEKSLFGAVTQNVGAFTVTAGMRLSRERMDGSPSMTPSRSTFVRGRSTTRVDPELAISLKLAPRLAAFAQYQQGFRTGGLSVASGIGRVASYDDDKIYVGEFGLRLVRHGTTGLAAVAAVSYAFWYDIQADLVSMAGFPYTANVGDGRIVAFEGTMDWVPIAGLRLKAGLFLNQSRLVDPAPDFLSSGKRPLPDTPPVSATAAVAWSHRLGPSATLRIEGNARYTGSSRLGVGPVLDLPYGNYLDTGLSTTLGLTRFDVMLSADNVFDARRNRFAIGNPFGVALRDEVTPLRPRTIRLGLKARF